MDPSGTGESDRLDYRSPDIATRYFLVSAFIAMAIGVLSLALIVQGPTVAAVLGVVVGVPALALGIWAVARSLRVRVVTGDDAFDVANVLRTHQVPLDELSDARIETLFVPWGSWIGVGRKLVLYQRMEGRRPKRIPIAVSADSGVRDSLARLLREGTQLEIVVEGDSGSH